MSQHTPQQPQLLLLLDARKADKAFYNQLLQYLPKSKPDIVLGLVVNQMPADDKLKNFVSNGKVVFQTISGKETLNQTFAGIISRVNAMQVLVCYHTIFPVSTLVSWYATARKSIAPQQIVTATQTAIPKGSKNKVPYGLKLYNSLTRLFSPVKLTDAASGIILADSATMLNCLQNLAATAKHHAQTLYNLQAAHVPVNEVYLGSDKFPETSALQALTNIITLRFGYYLNQTLFDIKHTEKKLVDGNHPVYRLAFFVAVLAAMFVYPYISQHYGSTWDEKAHNDYAQLSYRFFTSLGSDTAALAEPVSNADYVRQAYRFYGEQLNTIAAFLYNWFDTGVYETRHFVNSIYALIGLIFTGLIALHLSNWRGALIGLLFMAFNPGWLGHGSNNPTDIPFATGFAFAGYYMLRVMQQLPKPKFSLLFWLAFGIGLGIASRVGALLLLAYFGLFLAVNWLLKLKAKQPETGRLIPAYLKIFVLVFVISYFFGIITWPYGLSNPIKHPLQAFSKASENAFYTNNVELFEGVRMYMLNDAPWYYVIKFLGIGNPIYLLLGVAISLVILIASLVRKSNRAGNMLMLFFMGLFPVVYAELSNVNYYNGWRHYLFILPFLVPLSAYGYEYLIAQKTKWISVSATIVLLVLFAKPAWWMIKNHPHQYVYFNEFVGGLKGAYGMYETDYYSNSCRMAGEWIARQHPNDTLTIGINNEVTTAAYWAQQINPNLNFIWVREYEEQKPFWDYLILTSRTFSRNELLNGSFPPANTVYMVEADGVPLAAVVKRVDYNMPLGYKALDRQDFDSATYYFSQAVQLYPKDEETWRMLGFSFLAQGKLDTAEIFNRKAIEIYPQNFSAYSNMGIIKFNKKEFKEAIAFFDTAVKFKENLTECWYYGGLAHLNLGDYNNGIKYLENCTKHNGNFPEAYYYLARAYAQTGNLNKAAENYQIALGLNQRFVQAWQELANVFSQLGKNNEAAYCMQKFKELSGQ